MEPASVQDNSAVLSVGSIVLAGKEFEGKLEQMDHNAYESIAYELELPELVDKQDYNLLQTQIMKGMYDPEEVQSMWNEFYDDDIVVESIAEKTGNTSEFTDKQQPGNIGSRFAVPEFEFPVECRSCGERPRIEGSFYCPECHPERDAEDVDDEEIVDKYVNEIRENKNENDSCRQIDKEWGPDIYRVLAAEEQQENYNQDLLGVAVDMPESDVYVDWYRGAFPEPLDNAHVSIYGSIEDLTNATGNVVEINQSLNIEKMIAKSVSGHPDLPTENTAPELVEYLERKEREGYDPSEEDEALLYEMLGSGTPEWKMSKDDADYIDEPVGDEVCANCQFYYVGTDGEAVCSKVRGQVYPEHWCRLWEPGDNLKESSVSSDDVDKLFGREQSNSNGSQSGDNQFDKVGSGFEVNRRKVFERGAQLDSQHFDLIDTAFREQVWPDELQKAPSWTGKDDVTQDLQEWVNSVLELQDPIYDNYETVPAAAGLTVKQEIQESLKQSQGWSLNSIDRRLREEFKYMAPHERERIARQETAAVLNKSKIVSLQARGDDPLVRWVGPDDSDTTELCTELKSEIGDGVEFSKFMPLLKEYAEEYDGTPNRVDEGIPHIMCRHMPVLVEAE